MRKLTAFIVTLFILAPLGLLYYKHNNLNLSLLPHKVDDTWNLHISLKPKDPTETSVSFPIPKHSAGIRVTDERIRAKGFETILDRNYDSVMMTWMSNEPITKTVSYSARVDVVPVKFEDIKKDFTTEYPRGMNKYLKIPELSEEETEGLRLLEQAIYEGNEDKSLIARKAFYYVSEEIQRNLKFRTLKDALNIGRGTPLVKARMYAYMMRRKNIPARVLVVAKLPLKDEPNHDGKLYFSFMNEIFLNNRWIPVSTNIGTFGEIDENFLVFHRHYEEIEKLISKKKIVYNIKVNRAVLNKFNREDFRKEVIKKSAFFGGISLHRLPLPVQAVFSTILLIPLGALVLCVARNLLGVPTFGMFTPILLTVFFKETSLMFGLCFFLVVVLIGIAERYLLDKFRLLAIPRMSIILTLVIMLLMVVAITGVAEFFGSGHIGYFPIVIVTVFIERFSIMLTEDGPVNTAKTLIGTLVIAVLTFLIYSIETIEMLIFTNPELLFVVIAILILIGKYKGYRLSELIRFKNLVEQMRSQKKGL